MLPRSAACRASLNVLGLRRIDFSIATSDRLADYRHPELGRALTVRLRPLGHIALGTSASAAVSMGAETLRSR
jgi:hypothetical protein